MASYVPVVKNGANGAIFYVGLVDQSNTKLLKSSPTIASGDFKVSIDGGALANLGTLPTVTPAAGRQVKITLSQAEVNGDNITVQCVDAAGAEWCDLLVNIQTTARQIDDLAYPATSGRSIVVDAAGLVDSNVVKVGPTGSGTAQTAGDIMADTNDIQTRLPAALVSGRMDCSVGAMASGVVTATAIAADAITDAKVASDVTIASVTGAVGSVTGAVGSIATGGIAAASFAAGAIDAAAIATDAIGALELAAGAASEIATAVRTELGTELGRIDVATSTRLATSGYTAPLDAAGTRSAVGLASANLDTQLDALPTNAELATALGTADDAVLAQVALVKAKTDNIPASPAAVSDIPTAAANADAVWDEAIAGHLGAGSTGEALDNAGAAGSPPSVSDIADEVQTRTIAGVTLVATTTNLTNAPTAGDLTATMKTSVTTAATAATPTVTAGTVSDKTGYALTSGERTSIATAVWASVMEGSRTALGYMRGFGAALLGKASGMATTTATFRDVDDSKDRIVATVDADGNRSAITLDLT